jgi:hypothetical protein
MITLCVSYSVGHLEYTGLAHGEGSTYTTHKAVGADLCLGWISNPEFQFLIIIRQYSPKTL